MKEEIFKLLNRITPKEFSLRIEDDGYFQMRKDEDHRILLFGGGSNDFFKQISGFRPSLCFHKLEKVIGNKTEDLNYIPITMTPKQHHFLTSDDMGLSIFENFPLRLETVKELQSFENILKSYIKLHVLPFFDYWDQLTKFIPFMDYEFNDFFKMSKVFKSNGLYKHLAIWYYVSHPQYLEYFEYHLKRFENALEEDPKDKDLRLAHKKFVDLKNRLEEKPPLFEWNDEYLNNNLKA